MCLMNSPASFGLPDFLKITSRCPHMVDWGLSPALRTGRCIGRMYLSRSFSGTPLVFAIPLAMMAS